MSLRSKINTILEFKICPKKCNFDLPIPQKTSQFPENSHKKQLTPYLFTIKDKEYFDNFTSNIGLHV